MLDYTLFLKFLLFILYIYFLFRIVIKMNHPCIFQYFIIKIYSIYKVSELN